MGMRPFAFFLAASAFAQVPEYLPLTPGNQWVYRAPIGEPLSVSVDRLEAVDGRTYAVLRGLTGGDLWLRQSDEGVLYAWDAGARAERVYLDFSAATGQTFRTAAHQCNPTATIVHKDMRAKLPLGDFAGLIAVRYNPGQCADAGLTQDLYLPYVGLMRRTETSIIGPRLYDLVYARINGVVMVSAPEAGFAVHAAVEGVRIHTRLTLRNTLGGPLRLTFSSGQQFDLSLTNDKGEVVYTWSATRSFIQALTSLDINGEYNWAVVVPKPAAPGRYVLNAWLTTVGSVAWRASTPVEVPAQ